MYKTETHTQLLGIKFFVTQWRLSHGWVQIPYLFCCKQKIKDLLLGQWVEIEKLKHTHTHQKKDSVHVWALQIINYTIRTKAPKIHRPTKRWIHTNHLHLTSRIPMNFSHSSFISSHIKTLKHRKKIENDKKKKKGKKGELIEQSL